MGALFLATKQEEHLVKGRDLVNVFKFVSDRHYNVKFRVPKSYDEIYYDSRGRIFAAEAEILKAIGFHTKVNVPHGLAINYAKLLYLDEQPGLSQLIWNYCNDTFRTILPCVYPPPVIACTALFMGAREMQLYLAPGWNDLFDVDRADMVNCAAWLGAFYYQESQREKARKDGSWVVPLSLDDLETLLVERRRQV